MTTIIHNYFVTIPIVTIAVVDEKPKLDQRVCGRSVHCNAMRMALAHTQSLDAKGRVEEHLDRAEVNWKKAVVRKTLVVVALPLRCQDVRHGYRSSRKFAARFRSL